jgi:hypothetical protein
MIAAVVLAALVEPGRQREIRIYWTDSSSAAITEEPNATTIHQLDSDHPNVTSSPNQRRSQCTTLTPHPRPQ